jgi:hypothetical protein
MGTVAGEQTHVQVRAVDVGQKDDPAIAVELVVVGKGGAVETLSTLDGRTQRLEGSHLVAAYPSADRSTIAFATTLDTGMMCWDFQSLEIAAVSTARHRASLANTIGFRAWKQHKTADATAAFVEATQLDPGFSLGWYNRAAMESVANDVADATASFDRARALDASLARRACTDPDFGSLRASSPNRFSCP